MFKKVIAAAALSVLAGSVFAAPTDNVYAGLDLGNTSIDGMDGSQISIGGFVGYSFNTWVAVEGAYRHLGTWTVNGVDANASQTAVSVVGTLPLNEKFNLFGRIGYNRLTAEASYMGYSYTDHTNGTLIGIGGGYNFSEKISGRVELQKPDSSSTNVNVGVVYKF